YVCLVVSCVPLFSLFPYTTLFRSCGLLQVLKLCFCHPIGRPIKKAKECSRFRGQNSLESNQHPPQRTQFTATNGNPLGQQSIFQDRKSTRLNSSHQITSYAVFCLK